MNRSLLARHVLRHVTAMALMPGAPVAGMASTLRTVALSGQSAPGLPEGISILGLSRLVLNDAGHVAFMSSLAGNNVDATNNQALWFDGPGGLSMVVRTGSWAPGTPDGVSFSGFPSAPGLNNAGRIAFEGDLTGNGVAAGNNQGIWSQGTGALRLVARNGSPAPGTPEGVNYSEFPFIAPWLNDSGQTSFNARLIGSGINSSNDRGIWSEKSGDLALIARTGDPAPGMPEGVVFGGSLGPLVNLVSNNAGLAFNAALTGGGINLSSSGSIWSYRSNSLGLVVREGEPALDIGADFQFTGGGPPLLDGTGHVAFIGGVSGTGIDETNDLAIWSQRSGALDLLVRKGTQAPGTAEGVKFYVFDQLALNDGGEVAFRAYLTGTGITAENYEGIWLEKSGSLTLVVRAGSPAPGTPSGVNFRDLSITFPRINNSGQTAFVAYLTGIGVNASNNTGFWATDRHGVHHLIAREGDLLEVAPGDFRRISNLLLGRLEFNNLGQVAFLAGFTDGSRGIFVSNLVAIPEPGSIALISAVAAVMLVMRKRLAK